MTYYSPARVYLTQQFPLVLRALAITEVDVTSGQKLVARSFVVTASNDSQYLEQTIEIDRALEGSDPAETAHDIALEEAQFALEQRIIYPTLERLGVQSLIAQARFQRASSNGAFAALLHGDSARANLAKLAERVRDASLSTYLKWIASIRVTDAS